MRRRGEKWVFDDTGGGGGRGGGGWGELSGGRKGKVKN